MRIAVVGTGYVGLVSAACFAELGHTVIGVDIDAAKIAKLKAGKSTIYEPGLEELLERGLRRGSLSFTTDPCEALPQTQVLFCAVATPPNADSSADVRSVHRVCETVAEHTDHNIVFVTKSTVPVGTGRVCEERIAAVQRKRGTSHHIPVVSNPEFLREGSAVRDTLQPDRIIIGINGDPWAQEILDELYRPLTRIGKPVLFMHRESAELVKYASNAFLATKISFINMLSELCERTGANIRDVAAGMGLDDRIGPRFLHAGLGYGGSCLPKDVKALIALSKNMHIPLPIVEAVDNVNERQRRRFFEQILGVLPAKAIVGVWGLSFKPKTDDMRDAPSLDLIPLLLQRGHRVVAFDPAAMENARKLLPPDVRYADAPMDAARGADAVVLLTEWDIFRGLDLDTLRHTMKGKHLFDGRNVYEPAEVTRAGLSYHGLGLGPPA